MPSEIQAAAPQKEEPVTEQRVQAAPSVMRMSLWAVGSQLLVTFFGAFTSMILNRTLGPEGRGIVGLVLLWPPLLAALAGAGWPPAFSAYMSRSPEMCRAYWSAGQLALLAIAGLTCCAGWWAIPLLISGSPDSWELTRWYLLFIPLAFSSLPTMAGLEALQRFDFSSRIRVSAPISILCMLVPLAFLQELTPQTYCATLLISAALTTAYGFWLFAKASPGSWRPQWGPMPAYVLRAAPLNWAQALQLRVDQLVINALATPDAGAFGAYVVGTTLAGMVSPIAYGLGLVILPQSARQAEADAFRLFARMGRLFVLGAVVVGFPVALAAPWLLTLLYGAEFASAAYALRIGLLTAVFAGLLSMGLNAIQGSGRPGRATIIGVTSTLLSVTASALLLPVLGYVGAAVGHTLGFAAGLVMISSIYHREGLTPMAFVPRSADVMSLWTAVAQMLRRKPPVIESTRESPSTPDSDSLSVAAVLESHARQD